MMNFKSLAFLIFGFFIIGCSNGLFENSKKTIKGKAEILRFEDQNLEDSTIVEGYVVSRRENFSLDHVSVYTRQPLVGKLTDENGHFRFKLAPGKYDIISQYIGYTTFTIPQLEVKKKERLIILIKMGTTIQPLH